MKKYPKIKRLGDKETKGLFDVGEQVIVTEKLDGANFRFKVESEEIWFGSRNVVGLGNNKNQFRVAIDFIEDRVNPKELKKITKEIAGHNRLTFFGECMTRHSLDYNWDKIPSFLGFDIYDHDICRFLSFSKVKEIYKETDISTVPVVEKIDLNQKESISSYDIPNSQYREGIAEGVVFKNYGAQIFAKLRSEKFMEENQKAFGKSKKRAKTDNEKFVAKYCTNQRIKKMIYKLRDEGYDIEMPLMEYLPKKVWKDIWEENLDDIIWGREEIDMHETRSMVSSRCAIVLKMVITNQVLKEEQK